MSRLGAMHAIKHTGTKHTATVIFFHGSGATGSHMKEWVELVSDHTFNFPHIKVLFPTAPLQPYTPAGGNMSNVWFDRIDIKPQVPELLESVDKMKDELSLLIQKENEDGIPTNRIVLGGFSMGGAMAYHAAFRWHRDVAGVFGMSSFLNNTSVVYDSLRKDPIKKAPDVLHVHGLADPLVPAQWGELTYAGIVASGVPSEISYVPKLGHNVDIASLRTVKSWIDIVLRPL